MDSSDSMDIENTILFKAKLAEQAERYEDAIFYIKELVEWIKNNKPRELEQEERNLMSVAYKNSIGSMRASWRLLSTIELREDCKTEEKKKIVQEFKEKIEQELREKCEDILSIIRNTLLPGTKKKETEISYYKMVGDYNRYISEFSVKKAKEESAKKALEGYEAAMKIANVELETTHPIRLGLCLNFSVFYYEIMNNEEKACEIARKAFDDAIQKLETIKEEIYKDSTLIMQLLRDNLALWSSEKEKESEEKI